MKRKRIIAAGMATLGVFGGAVVFADSASAAAACPAEYSCVFDGAGYGGGYAHVHDNNTAWGWALSSGVVANNSVSSVSIGDLISCRVFFYDDASYGLTDHYIYFFDASQAGAHYDDDLSDGGGAGSWTSANWSNRFSSNQYIAGCTA